MVLTVNKAQMARMQRLRDQTLAREIVNKMSAEQPPAFVEIGTEKLLVMIEAGIGKARQYDCITKYSAGMFVELMLLVGPCFDEYPLARFHLEEQGIEPDMRMGNLLDAMNETEWEKAQRHRGSHDWNDLIGIYANDQ